MTDTIDVITLTGTDWQDLNTLSGIAVGTAISVQNQTNQVVFIATSNTKPSITFKGLAIPPVLSELASVSSGQSTVWVKGVGPIMTQEV